MTLRKRYTLIVIGFIIFVLVAPVLVLGIQGYIYDFDQKKLVKTGILVVRTDPDDAKVTLTLDGKTREFKSNKTVRFLPPGDYEVKIEKEGYHTWQKRLSIKGALVTWVNEGLSRKVLIPTKPRLLGQSLTYSPKKQAPTLPFTYRFIPTEDGTATANLIGLHSDTGDSTVILQNIPYREDAQIIPAPNGLIFIIMDRSLYQVGSALEYLAEGVDFAVWNANVNKLIYGNKYEINFYNPYDPGPTQRELINRTSEPGGSFCLLPDAGYLLRSYGHVIRAIELDGRDQRNIYPVIVADRPLEIVDCDNEGESVVINNTQAFVTYSLRE